jgi:hypothetical protein
MAVEPIWSAKELESLGGAVAALEELVQGWECENDLKITDIMVALSTTGRDRRPVGLVSLRSIADTELQFEALEASLTIA